MIVYKFVKYIANRLIIWRSLVQAQAGPLKKSSSYEIRNCFFFICVNKLFVDSNNTKSKLSFPSGDAVKKTVYLSLMEFEKKWTQLIHNWGLIMNQFILIFENRIQI